MRSITKALKTRSYADLLRALFRRLRLDIGRKTITWGLVGAFSKILDVVLFWLIFQFTKIGALANIASAAIATAVNFFMHRRWTFRDQQSVVRSGSRFILLACGMFLLETALIVIMIHAGLNPLIAKVTSMLSVTICGFVILSTWVFNGAL